MPELENQNTRDIRYVDEKLDKLKTDLNKALNKQGQTSARLEGQVNSLEDRLEDNTTRLEKKIDRVQENLTNNFNMLTTSVAKLTQSQEAMKDTLTSLADVRHILDGQDYRLQKLENEKQDKLDLKKERIKANSSMIVAAISGLLALIGVIFTIIFGR